ncbi:hypothetical protein UA08_02848 [Talaromyces atroroseus]|uniref:J domain-containing protein n=1 Tax=Talaromyces atroroseus TaxID=1441469 RepID=A0A225B2T9_TALAT|nr:hypothetical protein UA08_02848 [Talaromyces atroroseus]OKL62299.1 hypothetical protein UA08_02848 [Talaromyces atroroseus]
MRHVAFQLFAVAILVTLVAAWTKEDHEIFQIRDEIIAKEGANVTFYDFLEVKPNANQDDINKAYRKKSRQLHPDKVKREFIANNSRATDKKKKEDKSSSERQSASPKNQATDKKKGDKSGVPVSKNPSERQVANTGKERTDIKTKGDKAGAKVSRPSERQIANAVKEATERSARLNAVANILRGPLRERYDHFLRHGFPVWKGTGYYYSRFRPGLGTVLLGLFVAFGGVGHYIALVLSYRRQRDFMEKYIRHARKAAWGDERALGGIPGLDANIPAPETEAEESPAAMALNRRQKRMMERENRKESKKGNKAAGSGESAASGTSTPVTETVTYASGNKKRVHAENGKILVVDSIGNVFLEEETEDGEKQEFLLDVNEIPRPRIQNTIMFRLPRWLYGKIVDSVSGGKDAKESEEVIEEGSEYVYIDEADIPADSEVKASTGASTTTAATRKRGKRAQRK